jgi:hypothetical protein
MSTSNPLSFNWSLLARKFADFQPFSPAPSSGWNDKDGQAIYFIMAGSEYRLRNPTAQQFVLNLTSDLRTSYRATFNSLRQKADTSPWLTNDQKTEALATLDALEAELDKASTLPGLRIDAQFDHIRNNQSDDHCALRVEVVWSSSLNCWLPASITADLAWGDETLKVPKEVISLFDLPSGPPILSYLPISLFPVYGQIAQLGQSIALGMKIWNFAIDRLNNRADDGGRLYFPAVVLQGLFRILASITPEAHLVNSQKMPAPDLDAIGQTWRAGYDGSSITSSTSYRQDTYDITQKVKTNAPGGEIDATYHVSLPEIAWLAGGAGSILTFKISVQDTNGFAVIAMLFGNAGELQMVAALTQLGKDVLRSGPPTWRTDPTSPPDVFIDMFLGMYFSEMAMMADAPNTADHDDARDHNIPNIMSQVMKSYGNNMRQISSSFVDTGLPQLPSLNNHSDNEYDYGSRPCIAVAPSGTTVEVHYNDNGADEVFRDVLDTSSSVRTSSYGGKYQKGQDPAVAVLADGTHVLEVHGGNGNNQLYYNVGTLSGTSLSMPKDGTSYDKGEDPFLAVANKSGTNRIFEVHRSENAGSDNLYFNTATWNGSSISWSKEGKFYDNGVTPCAAFAPDQDTLLVAHEDKGDLKVRVGNSQSSDVNWFAASKTVMGGKEPALVVTNDNLVVLFGSGSDGWLNYSLGRLSSNGNIRWAVTGVRQHNGVRPCLARRPDGKLVLVYENTKYSGQMFGSIQTVNVPTGYYD